MSKQEAPLIIINNSIRISTEGFELCDFDGYWKNEIADFVIEFLPKNIKRVNITRSNIQVFEKEDDSYSNYIQHALLNSQEEVLTFITTMNAYKIYKKEI